MHPKETLPQAYSLLLENDLLKINNNHSSELTNALGKILF